MSCRCLLRVLMAHAQRLEVEVKLMRSKVKQLEEALATARVNGARDETDIFSPSSPPMPGAFEDVEEVAESIGSFSIGSDGAGKYHGRFAGSEVRCLMCYPLAPHRLIPRRCLPTVSVTPGLGKFLVRNPVCSTLNPIGYLSPMKTSTKTEDPSPIDRICLACLQKSRNWR